MYVEKINGKITINGKTVRDRTDFLYLSKEEQDAVSKYRRDMRPSQIQGVRHGTRTKERV